MCKTCADRLVQAVAELLWRAPGLACMPASIGVASLVGSKLHVTCGLISWLLRSQVEKLKQGSTGGWPQSLTAPQRMEGVCKSLGGLRQRLLRRACTLESRGALRLL